MKAVDADFKDSPRGGPILWAFVAWGIIIASVGYLAWELWIR